MEVKMKKFILACLFLISVLGFSLEKSGIKDYDNLDLSKGKIIAYFNTKKQIVEEPLAMFYRKSYGKKGAYNLVADFYADTDTPEKIFMLKDLDDEDSINGKLAYYNKNETISYVADMKNGRIDGQKTTFEKGKVAAVVNFSNNLANGKGTLYYKEKKYAEANYAYGFADGDFTLFYPDGSKVLTLTYKDNDVIKSQNFSYKLQKTGIPEFDSLDLSKGDIVYYYTNEGNITSKDSKDAVYFRKLMSTEGNEYLVVDYFLDSENVQGIGRGYNLKDFQGFTLNGPVVTYYDNGNLKSKSFYKNKKLDGETTLYDYFGNVVRKENYKDGLIQNAEFFEVN
jgi:antitoxin component YwqK of YwqJK toxin-antitoxin module